MPRPIRTAVAVITVLAVLGTGLFADWAGIIKVHAADPPIRTIMFYKWDKLYEMPQGSFKGMLMTDWNGEYYFTNGDSWQKVDEHGFGWQLTNININPYMSTGDVFYTRTQMDTPYFHYSKNDGDNCNAPEYKIELFSNGNRTKKYLDYTGYCIQTNSFDSCDSVTVLDSKKAKEKGIGNKVKSGDNILFWNTSGNDTALKRGIDYTGKVAAHGVNSEGDDDWTATRWKIYRCVGKEYNCLYTWEMDKDQVWTVNGDVILMDGETFTIPEGSILCIKNGSFFVNGTIKCYGTILVEDGGFLIPYLPTKWGGYVDIDGGSLLVMSGGRVYAGNPKGYLNATQDAYFVVQNGGTVINYGVIAAGRVEIKENCLIENHIGGSLLWGLALTAPGKLVNAYNPGDNTNNIGLGAHSGSIKTAASSVIKKYNGSNFWYPSSISSSISWKSYTVDKNGKVTKD